MSRSAAPTPVGRVLSGRYELVRHLARGGMADVYHATDRVLERPVAVKVFRAASPVDHARFDTEVLVMAGLNHPSLVGVFDAGEDDGDGYLVLELVEGPDLRSIIDERGRLPAGEVVALGADLADALDHVHRAGVVHRDVNPSNVLCGPDGRPRLTDFGIARLLDTTRITAVANTIGTAGYMAPEQVRGVDVGPAADVYALGLVLREALTGTAAFGGAPHEAAIARLARDPDTSTGVPGEWQALLGDMTAREPGDRPSAADVRDRLARRTSGGGAAGDPALAAAAVTATTAVVDDPPASRATTDAVGVGDLAQTEAVPAAGGTAVMPAAALAGMAEPEREAERAAPASALASRQARRLLVAVAAIVATLFAAMAMAGERGGLEVPPTSTASTAPVVESTTTTAAPAVPPPPADDEDDDEGEGEGRGNAEGKGKGKRDD